MTETQKQRISELAAQSAGWTDFKARVFHLDQLAIFGNLTVLQLMNACLEAERRAAELTADDVQAPSLPESEGK